MKSDRKLNRAPEFAIMTIEVSPETIEEFGAAQRQLMEATLAIMEGPGWKSAKKDHGLVVYKRKTKESPFVQLKGVISIPAPMEEVIDAIKVIQPVDKKTPKKERGVLKERRVVFGPLEDEFETTIFYRVIEAPMSSPRDYVIFRRFYRLEGGRMCYFHNSIQIEAMPKVKGHERAEMFFQGYLCEPDPENEGAIKLTFFAHSDPKGSLPAMLMNKVCVHQGYAAQAVFDSVMAKHAA